MLVLGRRVGDEILIGGNIRLVVIAIRGNQVRLGIDAPREVSVRRGEIQRRFSPPIDLAENGVVTIEPIGFQDVSVS